MHDLTAFKFKCSVIVLKAKSCSLACYWRYSVWVLSLITCIISLGFLMANVTDDRLWLLLKERRVRKVWMERRDILFQSIHFENKTLKKQMKLDFHLERPTERGSISNSIRETPPAVTSTLSLARKLNRKVMYRSLVECCIHMKRYLVMHGIFHGI